MANSLWFTGICDDMLQKLAWWYRVWPQGQPYKDAEFLHLDGHVERVVTQHEVHVPWTKLEFEHLIRILKAVRPKWALTADLERVLPGFDRARLITGNQRLIAMRSYHEDIKEILVAGIGDRTGESGLAGAIRGH